ncbi:MAG: polysaccharide biosynthesis/export family protein [Alphaproteobacteria bacterium]
MATHSSVLRHAFVAASAAALLGLAAGAGGHSNQAALESSPPQAYRIGAGDRIAVNVYGEQAVTGEYDVDDSGTVALPLAGRVSVKDMTAPQAEAAVADKLRTSLENPQVNVSVVEGRNIYILGEVAKPGVYPYRPGDTVLNAVALAGGYTYRAETAGISVKRPTAGAADAKHAQQDAYLHPGDIVIVPARWF